MPQGANRGFGPLVSAEWLRENVRRDDVRVLDLRWYLDGRSGRNEFAKGHIPGAFFVDLDRDVTGRQGAGRHPLPDSEQMTEAMQRAGVNDASRVVVYDDAGGSIAARLWWLLRWFGHDNVGVLDGGIQAWPAELEPGVPPAPTRGDFVAREPDRERIVDHDEVSRLGSDYVLLDARAGERYRGEVEPVDPKAGHIPGAKSAPWMGNLGPDGLMLPATTLRERFKSLGVRDDAARAVVYCGSGVTSCHHLLALEAAGLGEGRLYAGSWSDWSSRPDAPVATGDLP